MVGCCLTLCIEMAERLEKIAQQRSGIRLCATVHWLLESPACLVSTSSFLGCKLMEARSGLPNVSGDAEKAGKRNATNGYKNSSNFSQAILFTDYLQILVRLHRLA